MRSHHSSLVILAALMGCQNASICEIPKNKYFETKDSATIMGGLRIYSIKMADDYPSLKSLEYFDSILGSMKYIRFKPKESQVNDKWAFYPSSFGSDSGKTIAQYVTNWRSTDSTCLISTVISYPSRLPFPDTSFLPEQTLTVRKEQVSNAQ